MKDLLLSQYKPKSELVVEQHEVLTPKFPVVDFHTHYGTYHLSHKYYDVNDEVKQLHSFGVAAVINLDGFWDDRLTDMMEYTKDHSEFFVTFGSVDVTKIDEPNFGEYASNIIKEGFKKGIKGLKFFKDVSLKYKDSHGNYIRVDDERLKPIWETAAELQIPVLIHIADPIAFFKPVNEFNERFEELNISPEWSFAGSEFFTYQELMDMQEHLLTENPDTIFVVAHVGSAAENLGFVSQQLDKHPNMFVDIAARIAELGRQPYTARKFMIKYQDRILFGTDGSFGNNRFPYYYRFLETWDEYFNYAPTEKQGRWKIYGVGLPDDVLRKIYYENALKLIPSLKSAINNYKFNV